MLILFLVGAIRTMLIIAGVFVLLKFIGRLMITKRSMEEQKHVLRRQQQEEEMITKAKRNFGKTSISNSDKSNYKDSDFVDFEEIKED